MDCPKCGKGQIRVVTGFVCGCGHHPFVCDGCAQQFTVPHSSPPGTLPPDVSLEEDEGHRQDFAEMMEMLCKDSPPRYEEVVFAAIAAEPELFPLLEEFKASRST